MQVTDIVKQKLAEIIKHHAKYNLPDFLVQLRKAAGLSRVQLSKQTGIAEDRLLYIEFGKFLRPVPGDELATLAKLYGVELDLLQRKSSAFLRSSLRNKKRMAKVLW